MKNFKYAKNFLARLAPLDNEEGTKLPLEKVFPFVLTSILHTNEGGHTGPTIAANMKAVLTKLSRSDTLAKLKKLDVPINSSMDLMDRFHCVAKHLPLLKDEAIAQVVNTAGSSKQWKILLAVYYT